MRKKLRDILRIYLYWCVHLRWCKYYNLCLRSYKINKIADIVIATIVRNIEWKQWQGPYLDRIEITNTRISWSNRRRNNDSRIDRIDFDNSLESMTYIRFCIFPILFLVAWRIDGIQVFRKQNRFPQEISKKLDEYWNSYKVLHVHTSTYMYIIY